MREELPSWQLSWLRRSRVSAGERQNRPRSLPEHPLQAPLCDRGQRLPPLSPLGSELRLVTLLGHRDCIPGAQSPRGAVMTVTAAILQPHRPGRAGACQAESPLSGETGMARESLARQLPRLSHRR